MQDECELAYRAIMNSAWYSPAQEGCASHGIFWALYELNFFFFNLIHEQIVNNLAKLPCCEGCDKSDFHC